MYELYFFLFTDGTTRLSPCMRRRITLSEMMLPSGSQDCMWPAIAVTLPVFSECLSQVFPDKLILILLHCMALSLLERLDTDALLFF